MSMAAAGIYRAKWSLAIHEEWTRNLLLNREDLDSVRLQQTCTRMNAAVPDSLVTGYEALVDSIVLKDPDDRHVVAAAIRSNADIIVTFNEKDFDVDELAKYDLYTEHPDEFVANMLEIETAKSLNAVQQMRARLRNPSRTVDQFLDTLYRQGLPQSVAKLREFSHSL